MSNPVLVDVTRGPRVESRHRGALAVVDSEGRSVVALGDVGAAVFPRSAVKAIQALLLVESGAADAYGFGPAELALAAASHSGERRHVETAAAMLAAAGRSEADLECGVHWPFSSVAEQTLLRAGRLPGPLHNNCSGKHAGFICAACHLGLDPRGYVAADHPVQRAATAALSELAGVALGAGDRGIDGCGIPAYAMPLDRIALATARMATGAGLAPARAAAARRIVEACMAEPFMVAGAGRFETNVMGRLRGRVFAKGGAEGVEVAAFPELGLAAAVKIDDGAGRAAEVAIAAAIAAALGEDAGADGALAAPRPVTNRAGATVGEIRPSAALTEALSALRART